MCGKFREKGGILSRERGKGGEGNGGIGSRKGVLWLKNEDDGEKM